MHLYLDGVGSPRAIAIRLLQLGQKPEEVTEQQMVSLPTIYSLHKSWREHGLEGLANKKKPGRPAKQPEAIARKWKKF